LNIWHIASKEVKRDFRDVRTLIFMLAFPIVLMLVLGSALTNAFDSKIELKDMTVLYKDAGGAFSPYFEAFAKEVEKSGIHFKPASADEDGIKEVEDKHYTGYLEITGQGVHLYGSSQDSIESNIVQGMLTAFIDQYNVAAEVSKVDPKAAGTVFSGSAPHTYIQETTLNSSKQPGSMDYYAIAMTTMIALYGAMSASYLLSGERIRRTADRLIAAPINKAEIFTGKVLGSIVVNSLCLLIVVLFSKFAFHAYWGDHLGQVFAVLLTEVLLAVSFGLGISYLAGGAARMIVLAVVQVASFLGGAYFPTGDAEGTFWTNLSPLRWANTAITQIIYANDFSAATQAITMNLGLAVLFLLVASFSMKRREGL
jgi:ABC-2 type transport system permease protein